MTERSQNSTRRLATMALGWYRNSLRLQCPGFTLNNPLNNNSSNNNNTLNNDDDGDSPASSASDCSSSFSSLCLYSFSPFFYDRASIYILGRPALNSP